MCAILVGVLDTVEKSTGNYGKKRGLAQLRIYNLGNMSPIPVGKLDSILESLLNTKAKKRVLYMHANVSLAFKDFGYKPTDCC